MKEMTITTRMYLFSIYTLGAIFLFWDLFNWHIKEPVMLAILCLLASLALITKVEGATNRSHYTFSFILYGFAFAHLGIPQATIVILVSNLVEFLVKRPPWFIQIFNTACYLIVVNVAGFIFSAINPDLTLTTSNGILAIATSMAVFTLLNHLIVGIVVWMARGENFKQSGIFDLFPLIIDLTLLTLGAMLVLIWDNSRFALLLFAFPIYLIYSTMRVPALERQSETDQKTGLFNHAYFKQHLENELKRANRFDRPLTIIMADLDLLRNINNTYGHLAGDEVLIGIANILKESVREYDVVARFGGEEFSILMPETTLSQGFERAELIRKAVEKAEFIIPTSVTPIKATLSLGVASREFFDQTGNDIIHNSDTALYHSKLKGRNQAYAYTQEAYVNFSGSKSQTRNMEEKTEKSVMDVDPEKQGSSAYVAADVKTVPRPKSSPSKLSGKEPSESTSLQKASKAPVYIYIAGLFFLSLLLFSSLYYFAPSLYTDLSLQSWLGIGGCVVLVVLTEWYSIDLYTKHTSLSTSAVPILAGTLLFGPIGSFALSLIYAISTSIKHHSPFNRLVFNFSNQLIAGMAYTTIIYLTGRPFIGLSTLMQLILAVTAAIIVYGINTVLISIGMHLDTQQPAFPFWKEHYSWLFTIYIGMGIVAAAFVFGYKHDPIVGSLLVLVPLLLLRVSQVQYVERTRGMVSEMRVKNTALEKYSDEITRLNDGLLDTLAEIIDLRDPYVLGHSRGVTDLAVKLAKRLGLHEKQVELVRKGSLLHDIGKLGISQDILAKPAHLTSEEYDVIKRHPGLGAALLEKSPHLRPLIPIVRQHHEFFDGKGYPDKISGNQISIEARIVSIADAIEAMSSDRPYRKARSTAYIIQELERWSGTQFDPLVTEMAIQILREMESAKITAEAVEYAKAKIQKSPTHLQSFDTA
jgi:diguanylate cyclase (GGDEF)-like protein/putative nucleotidyltransferase with HDIG domain